MGLWDTWWNGGQNTGLWELCGMLGEALDCAKHGDVEAERWDCGIYRGMATKTLDCGTHGTQRTEVGTVGLIRAWRRRDWIMGAEEPAGRSTGLWDTWGHGGQKTGLWDT